MAGNSSSFANPSKGQVVYVYKGEAQCAQMSNKRRVNLYALTAYTVFCILSAWNILVQTDAQAWITFIFLPFIALVPAFIGAVIGVCHNAVLSRSQQGKASTLYKGVGIVSICALLIICGAVLWQTIKTITNQQTQAEQNVLYKTELSKILQCA
jgi:hypothetical protein